MTVVAIHQPNYAPWLGYFHKLAQADIFVLLDNAQFSKGSYTNRVRIASEGMARWLTIPVTHAFGASIDQVDIARNDWARAHLNMLRSAYRDANCYQQVWSDIEDLYGGLPGDSLAVVNTALVTRMAVKLGISTPMKLASTIEIGAASGDDRLIALCQSFGEGVEYLSGRGGANYQDARKFACAGIPLIYSTFEARPYTQGSETFLPGLSVLDAVFHLGWDHTSDLLKH